MARIRIKDLPADQKISREEMKKVTGGLLSKSLIADWESQLGSIGDDSQLANIDLQNYLQQQQQTMQMMSNVSKTVHDTSMAIIRKIG
jgi:hypothetical protein